MVIEMDKVTGAHKWRHAAGDQEITNNVLYAPNMLSIKELTDKAKQFPTKTYGKKEGVDFLVPSLSWVYLQPMPSYENSQTAEIQTGNIPFKRIILLRTDIDNYHHHAHWVVGLNRYWKHHTSHLCRIITNSMEMAEKEDGMNIEPVLPYYDAILYLG